MRGDDFLGGPSQAECTAGWAKTCSDVPPAGVTFDVNCSGAAHVNTAAKTMCLDELSTITCDDFSAPTYVSVCNQVCSAGAGNGGHGGAGGAGAPTDAMTFCAALWRKECQLVFDCFPADQRDESFTAAFGATLSECQGSKTTQTCTGVTCTPAYDPVAGNTCLAIFSAYACPDLLNPAPGSCDQACPNAGPGNAGTSGGGGTSGMAGSGGTAGGGAGGSSGAGASAGTGGGGGSSTAPNLIVNGDFSSGQTNWVVTLQIGTAPGQSIVNGQFCVQLGSYTTVTIGWPGDLSLAVGIATGDSYQLSYTASTSAALAMFQAKVGQAVPPYTLTDFLVNDIPGTAPQVFTHAFTATAPDPQAGLAFNISATSAPATVCLDDIALRQTN